MDMEVNNIELIERFLEEKLSPDELKEFETRMKNDQTFKELFLSMEKIIPGIRYAARNSLLEELKKVDKTLPDFKIKKTKVINLKTHKLRWLAAACIVAILVALTYLTFTIPPYEQIFADYYNPYPNVIYVTKRAVNDENLNAKEMAYAEYDKQNYTRAIELFENLSEHHFDSNALFYLGNAYLSLGNIKKAEEKFEQLLVNKGGFQIQAKWYLGLCYLKSKKVKRAITVFHEIVADKNSYSEKAMEILNQIK